MDVRFSRASFTGGILGGIAGGAAGAAAGVNSAKSKSADGTLEGNPDSTRTVVLYTAGGAIGGALIGFGAGELGDRLFTKQGFFARGKAVKVEIEKFGVTSKEGQKAIKESITGQYAEALKARRNADSGRFLRKRGAGFKNPFKWNPSAAVTAAIPDVLQAQFATFTSAMQAFLSSDSATLKLVAAEFKADPIVAKLLREKGAELTDIKAVIEALNGGVGELAASSSGRAMELATLLQESGAKVLAGAEGLGQSGLDELVTGGKPKNLKALLEKLRDWTPPAPPAA